MLLDVAQSTEANKRVVLTPLGTAEDGYTSAIVRILGLKPSKSSIGAGTASKTFNVRIGETALFNDLCNRFHVERSVVAKIFLTLKTITLFVSGFLASHIVSLSDWSNSPQSKGEDQKHYASLAQHSVQQ
jgi:hypothetical protein